MKEEIKEKASETGEYIKEKTVDGILWLDNQSRKMLETLFGE